MEDGCWSLTPEYTLCRVAGPIFVNLLLCPLREYKIDVRMTQGSILRRVSSVAMKVMNPGNIDAQPTASVGHHAWEVYVRAKLPIVDLDGGDAGGDTQERERRLLLYVQRGAHF